MEFVSTATETEALLLEANLIKRLRPRFNVLLRDDKSFPYILITAGDHAAPQIMKHRGARKKPGEYYGPFASARAVQSHDQHAGARVSDPLVHGHRVREPHAAVPAASDQALRGAVHRRDQRTRTTRGLVRRGDAPSSPARASAVKEELAGEDGGGIARARFRARGDLPRPPRGARPHVQSRPGHQSAKPWRKRT